MFNAGSSIQWLRDELGIIRQASDCDRLAEQVPDNGGVYLVSAFTGLGAPHWDMYARGHGGGTHPGTTRAHLCRAALEGIAYQTADLIAAMERDAGRPIQSLRVDGGASVSDFMMQYQADLLGVPVERPAVVETTAWGAACLAGLGAGLWHSPRRLPGRGAGQGLRAQNRPEPGVCPLAKSPGAGQSVGGGVREQMTALERFLKYITFDTQSEEGSEATPSTEKKQRALGRVLAPGAGGDGPGRGLPGGQRRGLWVAPGHPRTGGRPGDCPHRPHGHGAPGPRGTDEGPGCLPMREACWS